MRRLLGTIVLVASSLTVMMGQAPTFSKISTIAGSLPPFPTIQNNLFLQAPDAVFVDPKGNVYIADSGNNRVRRINASGVISTVAGTSLNGFTGDGGSPAQATLLLRRLHSRTPAARQWMNRRSLRIMLRELPSAKWGRPP